MFFIIVFLSLIVPGISRGIVTIPSIVSIVSERGFHSRRTHLLIYFCHISIMTVHPSSSLKTNGHNLISLEQVVLGWGLLHVEVDPEVLLPPCGVGVDSD